MHDFQTRLLTATKAITPFSNHHQIEGDRVITVSMREKSYHTGEERKRIVKITVTFIGKFLSSLFTLNYDYSSSANNTTK